MLAALLRRLLPSLLFVAACLAAAAAQAKLYVVIVASTEDAGVGGHCKLDVVRLMAAFNRITVPKDIEFSPLPRTWGDVGKLIRECPAGANDSILVFFTGHGGYNEKHGQFLVLATPDGDSVLPRTELRAVLKQKNVRLKAIMSNCCYNYVPMKPEPDQVGAPPPPEESAPLFRSLFLTARGDVDITSSQKDCTSAANPQTKGSIFASAVVNVLLDRSEEALGWDRFFLAVRDSASKEFDDCFPGGLKQDGKVIQSEQIALAFRLPGDTALDRAGPRFGIRGHNTGGNGVRIGEVFAGYPGQFAGLRVGDVIVGINGRAVRTEADYDKAIDASPQDMDVAIQRNGRQEVITVRLRY